MPTDQTDLVKRLRELSTARVIYEGDFALVAEAADALARSCDGCRHKDTIAGYGDETYEWCRKHDDHCLAFGDICGEWQARHGQ